MDRRNFMKAGLASSSLLLLPTLLTSCDITDSETDSDKTGDIQLLTKACAMEGVAVATYTKAVEAVFTTQAYIDVANAFKSHHTAHANTLNNVLKQLGASAVDFASSSFDSNVARVNSEAKALELATLLELQAAQAYFSFVAGNLVTSQAKSAFADILPAELSHYSFLRYARGLPSSEAISFLSNIVTPTLSF